MMTARPGQRMERPESDPPEGPLVATLPLQPKPLEWIDSYLPGLSGGVTTVTRIWRPGDTRHCRLCPGCTAAHEYNVCQVSVRGPVAAKDLPVLSLHGREFVPPADHTHGGVIRAANHGDAVG
jgi:hypothetical protein